MHLSNQERAEYKEAENACSPVARAHHGDWDGDGGHGHKLIHGQGHRALHQATDLRSSAVKEKCRLVDQTDHLLFGRMKAQQELAAG